MISIMHTLTKVLLSTNSETRLTPTLFVLCIGIHLSKRDHVDLSRKAEARYSELRVFGIKILGGAW